MSAIHSSGPRSAGTTCRSAAACSSGVRSRANERKRDRGFLAGDQHVERLDSERTTLALCAVHDSNGVPDAIAVAKREHGYDESPCEVALVLQRSPQREIGSGERRARSESASCVRGRVVEHAVEEVGRYDAGGVCGIQRVERREHDHAIAVAERGLDDRQPVLRRRIGSRTHQRRALRRSAAGKRGCEERDGRVGEPPDRGGRAARCARLLERCNDPTDDVLLSGIRGDHGVERRRADGRIRVVEEGDEHAVAGGDDPARAERGRRRAPLGSVGGAGEVGRKRLHLRSGLSVPVGGELDECPQAQLGIRVLRRLAERSGGSRRRDPGQQVEAEAHVTCIVGPEQRLERAIVLGDVVCARDERPASHLVRERARVRPVHRRAAHRPDHAQDGAEDDHGPDPETEQVHEQQHRARGADGDGDADAFDDGLDGETVLDRNHLERGVDGRAGGAVGQDDVGEAGDGREHEEAVGGGARPGDHHRHHGEQRGDDGGVQNEPESQAEATQQRPGEQSEEEDVYEVEHRRVPRQEPGQVVPAVVRTRAVEEEVVDQPRPHRRQHLVDEEEENETGREQCSRRRSGRALRGLGRSRADFRKPPLRLEQEAEKRELCDRRTEQQVLGRAQQGQEGESEEAAEEEPDREPAHDPWKSLLHLPHVQEPARLSADEHEPQLERDREQHQQACRHPDSAGHEDQPRRGVEDGDAEEARRGDANQPRAPRRPGDQRGRSGPEDGDGDVGRRQPLRSVRVEEERVRRDDDEREHHAERERLSRQQGDDAALGCVAHDAWSANSVVARRRDTSSAITPWASSGQSMRSSSSTAWSTRRTSVGSSAVTDAARGAGTSTASSPTVAPGPSSTSVRSPRCTLTRPSTTA